MHFASLQLQQFRNYDALRLELAPGVNCFIGPNGVGKTNLLEAVHYLAMTRGFHTDKAAVREGERYFMLAADLVRRQTSGAATPAAVEAHEQLQCSYMPGRGKRVLVDGEALPRLSDQIGRVPLVCLVPEDTDLIRGSGSTRRKWLDQLIAQFDADYLQALIAYERALQQRNALLKRYQEQGGWDRSQLALWEAPLRQHGTLIFRRRRDFLAAFLPVFQRYYEEIAGRPEAPSAVYDAQLSTADEADWTALYERYLRKDAALGYTNAGPHRDDLQLRLGGQPVKHFGSQGQQKTYVTALKFAEYEFLQQQHAEPPLLLLDDLYDKLDHSRMAKITHILLHRFPGQVYLTDTSEARLRQVFGEADRGAALRFFQVAQGEVWPQAQPPADATA